MRMQTAFAVLTLVVAPAGAAFATDYYVAPPGMVQACTADGSQACPWVGLDAAFGSNKVVGGDRLLLLDGDYGVVGLNTPTFNSPVVIQSFNGKNAHVERIVVKSGSNITLRNLSVWPSDPHSMPGGTLVRSYTGTSNVVVDGLDVRAGQDAANYMSWSQNEWLARYVSGINLQGPNSVIENSTLTGVYMGAFVQGDGSVISNNSIDGFSGDAYRITGNNEMAVGNLAQNCFHIDSNHADALQSYGLGSVLTGQTVKNNKFLEWASTTVNPLRCSLQGIFFGGDYDNLVIENNVVSVTAPHGLSVYGGNGVQILNNTVVNADGIDGGYPWIGVFNDGTYGVPSGNVLVANNIGMSYSVPVYTATNNIVMDNNSTVLNLVTDFTDITTFDYAPTPASGYIDTGDPTYAPATDITGAPRPYGAGPDRGAYEVGATASSTSTSGSPTGGGVKIISHGSAKFLTPPGQAKK